MLEKNCKNGCKIKMADGEDKYGFVNEISGKDGRFCSTAYSVFCGIELICNDAPDDDALDDCKALGEALA